jgi:putative transposase
MVHPYTPYCPSFAYLGRYSYFLTFVTFERQQVFTDDSNVELTRAQIIRAAAEKHFEVILYCFMPDHLHLIVVGVTDDADLKAFVKLAKQYAGFYYAREREGRKLWQHGSNDHIIRDDVDLLDRMRYVVNNPVAAGLVMNPEDYQFIGSQRWSVEEVVHRCRTAEISVAKAETSGLKAEISGLKAGATYRSESALEFKRDL